MLRSLLFAAASAVVLAACSSTPSPTPVPGAISPPEAAVVKSSFDRAMGTVEELVRAGNTPIAIERLMQLAGDTSITEEERAKTLVLLGDYSLATGGYNAEGAVGYYQEVLADHASSKAAADAAKKLPVAQTKVAEYLATLGSANLTRTQEFNALFGLGRHQAAIDVMTAYDLMPDNEALLAMYQIGYLCEDTNLTGRAYDVTDRDGTVRKVRFCDLGK
ncbi:hypothetical protein [Hyphomonas sp.]|uniref:hypothetical protein n=1 Tax=Hyphomonas sp. TaxID=87 RepID=UPI00391A374A